MTKIETMKHEVKMTRKAFSSYSLGELRSHLRALRNKLHHFDWLQTDASHRFEVLSSTETIFRLAFPKSNI